MIKLINRTGAQKNLPITFSISQMPFDVNVPTQSLYGRDGEVRTGKRTVRTRRFTIEGTLIYKNRMDIQRVTDALNAFLMAPPIEFYIDHADSRFLLTECMGIQLIPTMNGREMRIRIQMEGLDPFWYGQKVVETLIGSGTIVVGGTAGALPIIKTIDAVSELEVLNTTTGQLIEIITSTPGVIEIDCKNYTVLINDVNRLDMIHAEWFVKGFNLVPEENNLIVSTPIQITYRPRWY